MRSSRESLIQAIRNLAFSPASCQFTDLPVENRMQCDFLEVRGGDSNFNRG